MKSAITDTSAERGTVGSGWPTVSVVIPTRDRPELLRRAIRAALSQDYAGEIECLVVFDQSEPALPEDLEVLEGRRLVALANQRTPGLAGARNTGALAATGDLIGYCDDDDEWLPQKLRLQAETLRKRPWAIAVSSGIYVHTRGRDVRRVPDEEFVTFRDLVLSRRMEINQCNILVRRDDLVNRIGLADEELPNSQSEDYDWLLRAARLAPIAIVREPLVRIHWGRSSWFSERWRTLIAAQMTILERYPELQLEPKGLARIYGQLAFYHAAVGERAQARRWARRAIGKSWRERRAYLAIAVSLRLVSADSLVSLANRFGRGI
jgi:glycosyltransferase involved in cell wall biosynthesis